MGASSMHAHPSEPMAPMVDGLTGQSKGQQKRFFKRRALDAQDEPQRGLSIVQAGQNPTQAQEEEEEVQVEVYAASPSSSRHPPSHTQES